MKKIPFLIGMGLSIALCGNAQKPESHLRYTVEPGLPLEIGAGAVVAEARALTGDITEIVVGNGIQLCLTETPTGGVVVEAQPNILPLVQTVQSGQLLAVKLSAGLETAAGIKIKMPIGKLTRLHMKEGAYLEADATLDMAALDLFFESGSQGKCDLRVQNFSCTVMGGSSVRLSGSATQSKVAVKGGSELAAKKLHLQTAEIVVLGASTCSITVRASVQARVENESKLYYWGHPKTVATKTNLNGKIVRRHSLP